MDTWQVGILFSQTGYSRHYGASQLRGTLLALQHINDAGGVLGRPIHPIIYDPKSDAQLYSELANKLLMDNGTNMIFGCTASFSRKAVLPWLEMRNALLWYPTCYEGFEYSPNIIYSGASPNQLHLDLIEFLLSRFGKRYYCIGSNYIFPRESNRTIRDLLGERGGEVVAERYVPLDAEKESFRFVISDIKRHNPDVIFSTIVGPSTRFLYDSYQDAGFDPERMPIASLTTNEFDLTTMVAEPLPGHVIAAPYFDAIESEANERFLRSFKARFGQEVPADACAEAAYFQVLLFAAALEKAEEMDAQLIRSAVFEVEVDAPQGRVRIDADNNHAYLWPRIALTAPGRKLQIVKSAAVPVKPDPYLIDL
jgi:ABC-type branched-subunit amino acid transport system substrate-binding protein